MKAYKIVNIRWESYITSIVGGPSKYVLDYDLNKVTKSVEGSAGIMCFKNLEDAQFFTKWINSHFIILEVEGINRMETPEYVSGAISPKELDRYYERYEGNSCCGYYLCPPRYTICFESIKPIKIIQEGEFYENQNRY